MRIASVTKSFTATAILQLVADEKLSLDAHVSEFVPDIADGDQITVHQLLDMTAGVFSYTEDEALLTSYFANPQFAFTAEDALAIIRAHQPDFAPGTDVHYSDSNYVLLQLIAEKVTGQPFGETYPVADPRQGGPRLDELPDDRRDAGAVQPRLPRAAARRAPRRDPRQPRRRRGCGGDDLDRRGSPPLGGGARQGHAPPAKSLQNERLQTHPLAKTPKLTLAYGHGDHQRSTASSATTVGSSATRPAMFYLPKAKATIVVESNSDNVSAQSALWTFIGLASYLYPEQFPKGL